MKTGIIWGFVITFAALPAAVQAQDFTADSLDLPRHAPTWRFEMANDVMFDSDNQFTNGFSVQKYSLIGDDIDQLEGAPGFFKGLARRLLPEDDGLLYRRGFRIGQNMVTPDEIENPNIILDDIGYHGFLGVESNWIAFNDEKFRGFATTIGLVGEYSLAEAFQKGVHSLIDSTDPEGWEYQHDHEPILNFYYMAKGKFVNKESFDAAWNVDVALGNYNTGVNLGVETRIGRKPRGFTYSPDALGRGMAHDATLGRADGRSEFYMTLAARVWAWAYFMPLEGNLLVSGNEWTDDNTIDPENVTGQVGFGLHYVRPKWGVHLNWYFQTDNIDEDSLRPDLEVENNYGWLMVEWRFGD